MPARAGDCSVQRCCVIGPANIAAQKPAYERWVVVAWIMAIAVVMAMQVLWSLIAITLPHADTSSLWVGLGSAAWALAIALATGRSQQYGLLAGVGGGLLLGMVLPDTMAARAAFGLGAAGLGWLTFRSAIYLYQHVPVALDGCAKRHRLATAGWLLLACGSTILTARMGAFVSDPLQTQHSLAPGVEFVDRHCCATAYMHAAVMVRDGQPNPYHASHVPEVEIRADDTIVQELPEDLAFDLGPLTLDSYSYPPPFLLAPRMLVAVTDNMHHFRTLWFGLCGLLSLGAALAVSLHIGGRAGGRAVTWLPAVWIALPWLICLQFGNVHVALVALAVAAMVAFTHDRNILGGGLLAFVILAKISPGVLGAYLLVRRRWGAVMWTIAWSVGLLVASYLIIGPEVMASFVDYELPRLASGRAFDFLLDRGDSVQSNSSIFAVPFKFHALGLVADPWAQGPLWSWAYSLGVLALALYAGARVGLSRLSECCIWLALLGLASLRSPAAPGYVFVAWTWLIVLIGAGSQRRQTVVWVCLAWLFFGIEPAPSAGTAAYVFSLVRQFAAIGLMTWVVLRYRGVDGFSRHSTSLAEFAEGAPRKI